MARESASSRRVLERKLKQRRKPTMAFTTESVPDSVGECFVYME